MSKGTIGVQIQCLKCGSAVMEIPDGATDSTLIHCGDCGTVIGPLNDIHRAISGEAHTVIFGGVATANRKPVGK